MQKMVRFVGDNLQNVCPILQLERKPTIFCPIFISYCFLAKKSVFFPAVGLLEFVCELVQMDANQLQRNWQRYFDQINQQIKGVF
jgi:hypothetical protein